VVKTNNMRPILVEKNFNKERD